MLGGLRSLWGCKVCRGFVGAYKALGEFIWGFDEGSRDSGFLLFKSKGFDSEFKSCGATITTRVARLLAPGSFDWVEGLKCWVFDIF